MPTLELPTMQWLLQSRRRKSSESMFLKKRMGVPPFCSLKERSPLEVPSEPASTLGQNHRA